MIWTLWNTNYKLTELLEVNSIKKVILVEGKDDVPFIKSLVKSDIDAREIEIDKINGGGQLNNSLITNRLKVERNNLLKKPIEKLGIVLDLDAYTIQERLDFLNISIQDVFGIILTEANQFELTEVDGIKLQIGCHFVPPNLDVLLRKIAKLSPSNADCLYQCLDNDHIKTKERDKAWVYYYQLWDVCNKNERENRSKHINFEYTLQKGAWDLESDLLVDLKKFLTAF